MAYVMIWDPYERLLWGLTITFLIIAGAFYIIKGRKQLVFNQKVVMYGIANLLIGLAISRIFLYIYELSLTNGYFIGYTYYAELDIESIKSNDIVFLTVLYKFTMVSYAASWIGLILGFEIIIKRTKYLLSAVQIFIVALMILFPIDFTRLFFNYLIATYTHFISLFIFIYYTKKSELDYKAISSVILFGFILILLGVSMQNYIMKSYNIFPLFLAPIICMIGTFVVLIPNLVDSKIFSQALKYWKILGIAMILLYCTLIFVFLVYNVIYYSILFLVLLLLLIYAFYQVIRSINISQSLTFTTPPESKGELQTILRGFTQPKKVTEEEVSVSKEKKICLVCKGKVSRYEVYLCPECEAIYCHKCAHAIENLENACWVCEKPFDVSKPVKLEREEKEKKEEIEVEIEEKMKRKGE